MGSQETEAATNAGAVETEAELATGEEEPNNPLKEEEDTVAEAQQMPGNN